MTLLRNNCSIEEMNGGITVVNIQTVVPVEIFLQETPDIVNYVVENIKNILQEKINEIKKEENETKK